ncbi:GNAT family acetyltransferase (plasmid) [Tistrella mobilis]|uniref:GNAT family acetyltransferase n=1 Tax=Tistrella mobilis TaxID=171437 RepID=UPI00355752DC
MDSTDATDPDDRPDRPRLTVGPVHDAELPALVALWQACNLVMPYNDPLDDIAFARGRSHSDVLAGRLDGRLVASVMAGHDGHRGWLYYVAVDPTCRQQGLGTDIVTAGEDWLRRHGVRKVLLMIRETNTGVKAFYEKAGYQAVPRVVMEKWV